MSREDLFELFELDSVYTTANGILLCSNCHFRYDNYIFGITTDGVVVSNYHLGYNSKKIFSESEKNGKFQPKKC